MDYVSVIVTAVITGIISFIVGGALSYLVAKLKKEKTKNKANGDGIQCLLHRELKNCSKEYTRLGFCPVHDKEYVTSVYTAYHNLGGNGVATKLYNDIMVLPDSEAAARRKQGQQDRQGQQRQYKYINNNKNNNGGGQQ